MSVSVSVPLPVSLCFSVSFPQIDKNRDLFKIPRKDCAAIYLSGVLPIAEKTVAAEKRADATLKHIFSSLAAEGIHVESKSTHRNSSDTTSRCLPALLLWRCRCITSVRTLTDQPQPHPQRSANRNKHDESLHHRTIRQNARSFTSDDRKQKLDIEADQQHCDIVLMNETWRQNEELWTTAEGHTFAESGIDWHPQGVTIIAHRWWTNFIPHSEPIRPRTMTLSIKRVRLNHTTRRGMLPTLRLRRRMYDTLHDINKKYASNPKPTSSSVVTSCTSWTKHNKPHPP